MSRTGTARVALPLPSGAVAVTMDVEGVEHLVVAFEEEAAPPWPRSLTLAERAVAELLVAGLSTADIARARGRSRFTVSNQIGSLLRKLAVSSRAALVARQR
jgi:DNA-binding CsgD family transcriptional regulator